MSKAQLASALLLVALFGVPAAAHAAPVAPASTHTTVALHAEGGDDGSDDGEDNGDDGGGSFSPPVDTKPANPQDTDDSFVVPPVVIHPDGKHSKPLDQNPANVPPVDGKPLVQTDVPGDHPIQVDKVQPSNKTPTDLFVDTAVIGLGAVGAGALGLGAMVGVRAIRARKSGEKADYFYGD